jgi:MSHA biogenesis protein MshI
MSKWRKRLGLSSGQSLRLGLSLNESGFAGVAYSLRSAQLTITGAGDIGSLKTWVSEHKLADANTALVLAPDQYQLLQVEKPAVKDHEVAEALRWRLGDMIDFDPAEAALDVFPVPAGRQQGRSDSVYVAVAHKPRIAELLRIIEEAGLTPWKVDITELALRNLSERLANDVTAAVVHLSEPRGMIQIVRNETLSLSRRMDVSKQQLEPSESSPDAYEALTLDVQRTMDYYDSNIGGAPVKRVLVSPPNQAHPALLSTLGVGLGIPVEALDLSPLIETGDTLDDASVIACGGALNTAQEQSA